MATKKTEEVAAEQNQEQQEVKEDGAGRTTAKTPAFVEELLKNGSVMLTANTRDDLFAQVETIKNAINGGRISAGAVGYNYDESTYCLFVKIIND